MALLTPLYRKRLQGKFEMGAQANATLVELVGGVQTVKALAIEGTVQRQWEDKLAQFLQSGFRLSTLASTSNALTTLLQKLLTLTILFVGVMMVLDQKLSVGQLIAFNMFTGQLTGPVLRLAGMWNEFQQTLLAVDRLGDILNQPVESAAGKAVTLPRLNGHVQFDNVGFRYHPDLPRVLSGLSLDIPAGSSLGIVGPSGSGKSTLAKLVQRLYTAQEGVMYIDGVDVRHFHPHWLRYQIGVVLQESVLFSGTIAENIALPRPDAPFELILEASRAAGAHEFITQLPEGYETPVGERGASLSGGQRQRIAIARALITQPRLLIMDEATSALDAESERFILGQMDRIKKGRTVLIIAHRLAAVRACDRIVVLDRGQVTESGTHAELMALNGLYTQLHRHQAGEDGTA
jgi:subfamily B ATP-binding cassette protein HlyB/CyaB